LISYRGRSCLAVPFRFSTSGDARTSSSSLNEARQVLPNGKEAPLESFGVALYELGFSYGPEFIRPSPQLRTSWIRDERTGKMVSLVRSDDDDFDELNPARRHRERNEKWTDSKRDADRVRHTSNNITIITLGDDSVI
uniref:Protein kinase domain-containing protein n=1 Tax=Angiostrongylus costaricensis TaxID=334426 RepID=A0A0R3PWV8_ANGCS